MGRCEHPSGRITAVAAAMGLALGLACGPAGATSASTDQSDLWWIPAESGWGIQLVQQHDTIFATTYVYAPTGQPEFYVAVLERSDGLTWSGKAYRATGPYWGGLFVPAAVVETEVGTMSFTATTVSSGRLEYTIAGVNVVKLVERMALANERLAATYTGVAKQATLTGACASFSATPTTAQFAHAGGGPVSVSMVYPARTCTVATGSYTQRGQFGRISGAYACTDGETGTMTMSEVKVGVDALTLRYGFTGTGPSGACTIDGDFAGVRQ